VSAAPPSRSDLERRFTALLAVHGSSVARLAGAYVRDASEREDLVQEIAMAIWRALPAFRGECSERTFIFRIAHNRAVSHLARRRVPIVDVEEGVEVPDTRPNPEDALAHRERDRGVVHAIRRLPLGHRQVLTLALEGMSYAEIAEVLGISESNVGARLTRARDTLRALVR
jgi:RNA polymerase sigma-70 factor (ECF subfamily)